MNAIEFNEMKIEAFRELAETQDVNVLEKVLALFHKNKAISEKRPCLFTVEELKFELLKSEEAIKQGRVHTMEEMRAKHPQL
jgi:hypothetical protein